MPRSGGEITSGCEADPTLRYLPIDRDLGITPSLRGEEGEDG